MPVRTKSTNAAPPDVSPQADLLMHNLITSLDLARSMQMTMLEQLLEMSLIELGNIVAAQEKSARDRGLN